MHNNTYVNVQQRLLASKTDKEGSHFYGMLYELLLNALSLFMNRPLRILELGIREGYSLQCFSQLPIVEKYVGVDLKPCEVAIPENADFHCLDVYSSETVAFLAAEYSLFDVVIDDALHALDKQQYALDTYTRLVVPGGYYIIEDVSDYNLKAEGLTVFNINHDKESILIKRC